MSASSTGSAARSKARVLVTRPESQSDTLIDALQSAGAECLHLPMLSLSAVDDDGQLKSVKSRFDHLGDYDWAIFISSNAVHYAASFIARWQLQWPAGLGCIPIGGATAQALSEYSMPVEQSSAPEDESLTKAQETSERLLATPALSPQQIKGKRVMIFRGVGGRELLAQSLSARGATVDYCELYRREYPQYEYAAIAKAVGLSDNDARPALDAMLFASGETLENFYQHLVRYQLMTPMQSLAIVVPSQRVAELACEYGFQSVLVAQGASAQAFVKALQAQRII